MFIYCIQFKCSCKHISMYRMYVYTYTHTHAQLCSKLSFLLPPAGCCGCCYCRRHAALCFIQFTLSCTLHIQNRKRREMKKQELLCLRIPYTYTCTLTTHAHAFVCMCVQTSLDSFAISSKCMWKK